MDELSAMLGELGDCLEDDVAPTQLEADRQNRAILQRRIHRVLVKNPALAEQLGELGFFGKALKTLGKGLTAPMRMAGKIATGDFKGALKAAVDPLGIKEKLLGGKGKKVAGGIQRALGGRARAAASLGARAAAKPALRTTPFIAPPPLQLKCTPCNTEIAKALTTKVVPEVQKVQKLLDQMELSRKATSEHKKKQQQRKWRKQVLVLLKRIQQKRCA